MGRIANASLSAVDVTSDQTDSLGARIRSIGGILPEPRASASSTALRAAASTRIAPGTCVEGKYILCDLLGTGGSAFVYAAEQIGLKRVVAFKHYPLHDGLEASFVESLGREARLLERIHHPNVVAVYDSGTMPDGSLFLVVQCLRGDSLTTRMQAGPLPVAEAVQLASQVLSALCALGDLDIVHRDIKPDNLMFDHRADGSSVLKLVDFGIASMTEREPRASTPPELVAGTPPYMAPEQILGGAVDARCDLYALGATLYEMLTGVTPHVGETVHDLLFGTLYDPIKPVRTLRADCPEALEQVVMKALAREPGERFASAQEMKRALDGCAPSRRPSSPQVLESACPVTEVPRVSLVRPISAREPESALKRRTALPAHRAATQGIALAAVACLAALGSYAWSHRVELQQSTFATGPTVSQAAELGGSALDVLAQAGSAASAMQLQTASAGGQTFDIAGTMHKVLETTGAATQAFISKAHDYTLEMISAR